MLKKATGQYACNGGGGGGWVWDVGADVVWANIRKTTRNPVTVKPRITGRQDRRGLKCHETGAER